MDIICCLTSYPKRIKNCYRVIKSLAGNTMLPTKVYLTLARTEFPNGIDDLPPLLRKMVITHPLVHLNWVDVNTGIMKKVIPVLKFLDDDDLILCCDDDFLYPSDYIESRVNDFIRFNAVPLTGCSNQKTRTLWNRWGIPSSIGFSCCFQKKHVANIDRFVDFNVMNANNSDGTYSMVQWLNGYVAHDVTKYGMDYLVKNCQFNEVNPSRFKTDVYLSKDRLLDVFRKRICELTHMDIFDCVSSKFSFGFFNKDGK